MFLLLLFIIAKRPGQGSAHNYRQEKPGFEPRAFLLAYPYVIYVFIKSILKHTIHPIPVIQFAKMKLLLTSRHKCYLGVDELPLKRRERPSTEFVLKRTFRFSGAEQWYSSNSPLEDCKKAAAKWYKATVYQKAHFGKHCVYLVVWSSK